MNKWNDYVQYTDLTEWLTN